MEICYNYTDNLSDLPTDIDNPINLNIKKKQSKL